MSMNEMVAAFETARRWARSVPLWRLRVEVWKLRRRVRNRRSDLDKARLVAMTSVLGERASPS